jgi:hypothetical protein
MHQPEPIDQRLLERGAAQRRLAAVPWPGLFAPHRARAGLFVAIILASLLLTADLLVRLGAAQNIALVPFYFPNGWMGLLTALLPLPSDGWPPIAQLLILAAWLAYWAIPVVGTLTVQPRRFQTLLVIFILLTSANIAGAVTFLQSFCALCGGA